MCVLHRAMMYRFIACFPKQYMFNQASTPFDGVILCLWRRGSYSAADEIVASNTSAAFPGFSVWATWLLWVSSLGMSSSSRDFVTSLEVNLPWYEKLQKDTVSCLFMHMNANDLCIQCIHGTCSAVPQTVPNHHWCFWRVSVWMSYTV